MIVYTILHTLTIIVIELLISNKIVYSEKQILLKLLPICLIGFSALILTFLIVLLVFQIKNICVNSTTSEELRKETVNIPNFSFGSTEKNCTSFQNEIFSYKSLVDYNKDSKLLLSKNKLLVELNRNLKDSSSIFSQTDDNNSSFELNYKCSTNASENV
jgi:hypothetical protein